MDGHTQIIGNYFMKFPWNYYKGYLTLWVKKLGHKNATLGTEDNVSTHIYAKALIGPEDMQGLHALAW